MSVPEKTKRRNPGPRVDGLVEIRQGFDAVFPLLRHPRPRPALAVHKKLPEVPLAFLHLRHIHDPCLSTIGLAPTPAHDAVPATQDHSLAGGRGVHDRGCLGSRVLGAELEWLIEVIRPAAEHHTDGPWVLPRMAQCRELPLEPEPGWQRARPFPSGSANRPDQLPLPWGETKKSAVAGLTAGAMPHAVQGPRSPSDAAPKAKRRPTAAAPASKFSAFLTQTLRVLSLRSSVGGLRGVIILSLGLVRRRPFGGRRAGGQPEVQGDSQNSPRAQLGEVPMSHRFLVLRSPGIHCPSPRNVKDQSFVSPFWRCAVKLRFPLASMTRTSYCPQKPRKR